MQIDYALVSALNAWIAVGAQTCHFCAVHRIGWVFQHTEDPDGASQACLIVS
jgi:hypothetical protein